MKRGTMLSPARHAFRAARKGNRVAVPLEPQAATGAAAGVESPRPTRRSLISLHRSSHALGRLRPMVRRVSFTLSL